MSLVENDPILYWLWSLPVVITIIIAFMASPWAVWVIEFFRAASDSERPPYGLTIFRYRSNFIGDLLLALLTGLINYYYNLVKVSSSILTGIWFFGLAIIFGLSSGLMFIYLENHDPNGYLNETKKFNWNRFYHFWYYSLMVYILFGFLRSLFYWQEPVLMALAFVLFLGWFSTVYLDGKSENRLWLLVKEKTGKSKYL